MRAVPSGHDKQCIDVHVDIVVRRVDASSEHRHDAHGSGQHEEQRHIKPPHVSRPAYVQHSEVHADSRAGKYLDDEQLSRRREKEQRVGNGTVQDGEDTSRGLFRSGSTVRGDVQDGKRVAYNKRGTQYDPRQVNQFWCHDVFLHRKYVGKTGRRRGKKKGKEKKRRRKEKRNTKRGKKRRKEIK